MPALLCVSLHLPQETVERGKGVGEAVCQVTAVFFVRKTHAPGESEVGVVRGHVWGIVVGGLVVGHIPAHASPAHAMSIGIPV